MTYDLSYNEGNRPMEVGIGLPNTLKGATGDLMLEWARRAESGPFASLAVFDRLRYDSYDPLITLAAARATAAWIDAGRTGRPRLWAQGYYALGEEAAEAGRAYMLDYYAFTGPFAERIAAGLLTTPQAIVQFVRGYAEAGCDHLVLFPTTAHLDQLDRLANIIG